MDKTLKIILIGIASIVGLAIVAMMVGTILFFLTIDSMGPCGMDDGPFIASKTNRIPTVDSVQTFLLQKEEKILLYNENDSLSPILTLVDKDKSRWSLDIGVRRFPNTPDSRVIEITEVSIVEKAHSFRLNFKYRTIGGTVMGGRIDVNKNDGSNHVCLGW